MKRLRGGLRRRRAAAAGKGDGDRQYHDERCARARHAIQFLVLWKPRSGACLHGLR